jgi:ribosome biogenesis GTPase
MRELQLWDADTGLDDTFDEIGVLGANCRFRDCQHETEPGCAVLEAIANGSLDPDRMTNYRKLKRELQFLERRKDPAAQAELRKRWKHIHKAQRRRYKSQG